MKKPNMGCESCKKPMNAEMIRCQECGDGPFCPECLEKHEERHSSE